MSDNNLIDVNRLLLVGANGNIGDVLTRQSLKGVGWTTPGGIAGIGVQNAGVVVAGGPFTSINALTGAFANGGAGVATYTPPAVTAPAWTTLSKAADQAVLATGFTNDDTLFFAVTAGVKYRVRCRVMLNNTGGGSFGIQAKFISPALTFYREQLYDQQPGTGGNLHSGNIATAPGTFSSANTGEGALEYFLTFTPSANGTVQFQFGQVAGGVGTATVYAGSFLEYGVA